VRLQLRREHVHLAHAASLVTVRCLQNQRRSRRSVPQLAASVAARQNLDTRKRRPGSMSIRLLQISHGVPLRRQMVTWALGMSRRAVRRSAARPRLLGQPCAGPVSYRLAKQAALASRIQGTARGRPRPRSRADSPSRAIRLSHGVGRCVRYFAPAGLFRPPRRGRKELRR
jgi:hypothetical protein